jgi:hypothetical protein
VAVLVAVVLGAVAVVLGDIEPVQVLMVVVQ